MKPYFPILALFISTAAFGQTRDTRALLDIEGRVNEISVSPDEKIWLVTAIGKTYFTGNIDSNWHSGKPLFSESDESGIFNPHFDRISFFNKDTAMLTGYISLSITARTKGGYYHTKDGGQTWEFLNFGGDSWIYDAFVDKKGNAWMGGSSGEIFFSRDFGEHWEKLNSPFNDFSRMHDIFMVDPNEGISGALHNFIYLTKDNWKSFQKIETPFDQHKYENDEEDFSERIEKILIWNDYLVVDQNGHFFYTESAKIEWQPFPVKIVDFELDKESQKLFAVTDSLIIILFDSPAAFRPVTDKPLNTIPIDLEVVNHTLFAVCGDHEVYSVTPNSFKRSIPYTTDKKISSPEIIRYSGELTWGIQENQIYLSENGGRDWYRENVLDFRVADFRLLNDTVAVLWDGVKNNYQYLLREHTAKIYFPEAPLKSFTAFPIKHFSINAGSQGCFHSISNEINYKWKSDSTFTAKTLMKVNSADQNDEPYNNEVNGNLLSAILNSINGDPAAIPSLADFRISEQDKKKYLALVAMRTEKMQPDFMDRKKINKSFYNAVPEMLDTLGTSVIQKILEQQERFWSTTTNWFTIEIVNTNHDTLHINRYYTFNSMPWNLPWQFEYHGQYFNCYSIAFSKYINDCIPGNFMDKDLFDNKLWIMEIAHYLYNNLQR